MNVKPVTLLISTYNWPEALALVFKSIGNQTMMPDEILIADDGSKMETKEIIDRFRLKMQIPVVHFWHEDQGFRKTVIMNEALNKSNGKYIIQIDGDIILHPKFIADHVAEAKIGFYIKGSRAMLSQKKTEEILSTKRITINPFSYGVGNKINASRIAMFSRIFRGDKLRSDNLRGCNFSFWKEDFIAVNGYNNDMQGWGHEDIEMAARLTNLGIKQRQLKLKAVCYHLYHIINSRFNENINYNKYLKAISDVTITCKDGIRHL